MKDNLNDGAGGVGQKKKNYFAIAGAVVLLLLVGGALAAHHFAPRLIETDKLRSFIAARIGRELGGNGGVHPLNAHGFSVDSLGLVVTTSPPRALTELRAHNLSASFSLIELWRAKWRINQITANHLQVAYGAEAARMLDRAEFATPELVPPAQDDSLMSVDIRRVSVARTDLFWGDPEKNGGQLRDVAATFFPDGKNLSVQGSGGSFQQAKWPKTGVTSFKLYYAKPKLQINEGYLTLGGKSAIDVKGGFQFEKDASMDLQLKFVHCPIAPFLSKDNGNKIDGTFVGDAHLQKVVGKSEELTATGTISVETAMVKNVVALEKAAAFTGESKLNPLHLDELRGDFRFEAGKLVVRDFRAEARHVLRVQGSFSYHGGDVESTFELGVAPGIVDKFPGARKDVFTRAEDDYLWTEVKLSGPLDHPNDDLKPRLMSALQKHFAFGLLEPLIKPGQAAREMIELIFAK